MDVVTFTDNLRRLSAEEIRRCAAGLQTDDEPVADQVTRWRAELGIDRLVRRQCTRAEAQQATGAAQATARLVVEVARRRGIALPDSDVTRVARAAGQITRGLALDGLAEPYVGPLLRAFETALAGPASSVPTAA